MQLRRILLLLALLLLGIRPLSAQLVATERAHDFGRIAEKEGVASHTFTLLNESSTPAVVTDVITSCKCIEAAFSHKPVLPGEKTTVRISFDPAYRPGVFSKEVRIFFNDRKSLLRVWIKGEVIGYNHPIAEDHPYDLGGGLHSSLERLLIGGVRPGESRKIRLRYANGLATPMHLRFETQGKGRGAITMRDTLTLQPDQRGEVEIRYTQPMGSIGKQEVAIQPIVNGKPTAKTLPLTAIGLPARSNTATAPASHCTPTNLTAAKSTASQRFSVAISNTGNAPLRILSVDLPQGARTTLQAGTAVAAGATLPFEVSLQLPTSATKGYHDRIYIVTNDPSQSYITLQINTK